MKEFIKKLDELENRVRVLEAAKDIAAAPPAVPTPTEELPGMGDLDEFKPEGFDAATVPAADGPPGELKETLKKMGGDPFKDNEVEISEEAAKDLQDMIDDDAADEEDAEEGFFDCPACGGVAIINKSMHRCPNCQNILDWSDEE